jgi:hypothetical protein
MVGKLFGVHPVGDDLDDHKRKQGGESQSADGKQTELLETFWVDGDGHNCVN